MNVRLAAEAEAYPGSVALLRYLRRVGVKTAVVTSSQNCRTVLRAAKVDRLFDARVDGTAIAQHGLSGKPAPDSFLMAAEILGVKAERGRDSMHLNKRIGVGVFLAGLVAVDVSQANPPRPLPRDTSATEERAVTVLCCNDIHWSARPSKQCTKQAKVPPERFRLGLGPCLRP